jgi:hypothetical protein
MVLRKLLCLGGAVPLAVAGALVASEVGVSAATVVVVSGDGQHGWHSLVTDGSGTADPSYGSVTFVTGPGTPPHGVGSVRLKTNLGKGDGSAQTRNTNYGGTKLANLTELNYYAYSAANNGQQFPFLSLDVLAATTATGHDRLFFEPPYQQPLTGNPVCPDQGPTVMVTWQKWDALNGCWWDNNGELGGGGLLGVQPLSTYITNHPDAAIVNYTGLGGLRLAVGFASSTDNFDGNVDMVTVGVSGRSTSYDFEPPPVCSEADGGGDFQDQNGHHGNVQMDNDNCEESGHGGNGDSDQGDRVDSSNRGDGKDFHSTSIQSTNSDTAAHTMTITGLGTSNGIPVAFTLVAVETDIAGPGWVSMVFSDGYSVAGTLLNGSITLH